MYGRAVYIHMHYLPVNKAICLCTWDWWFITIPEAFLVRKMSNGYGLCRWHHADIWSQQWFREDCCVRFPQKLYLTKHQFIFQRYGWMQFQFLHYRLNYFLVFLQSSHLLNMLLKTCCRCIKYLYTVLKRAYSIIHLSLLYSYLASCLICLFCGL